MKKLHGIFVTGTDTDVGKTAVTAALLTLLRRQGIAAAPMKPVQTGCMPAADGSLAAPDLDFILRMVEMPAITPALRACMTPYCYEPACSPHLAAANAGKPIELVNIAAAATTLAMHYDFLLVEGAGGVLVPLNDQHTMLDLVRALRLSTVIVTRPGLGTLNHTFLTIQALRRAEVNIAGVVFAETAPTQWGMIEQDNIRCIERLGKVPVIGIMPYMRGLASGRISARAFARRVAALNWNHEALLQIMK